MLLVTVVLIILVGISFTATEVCYQLLHSNVSLWLYEYREYWNSKSFVNCHVPIISFLLMVE